MEVFIGQGPQSPEASGTHDNISPDSASVPLATLYAISRNNSLGVLNNDIGHGLGMADGVVEGSIGWGVDSGQATSIANQIRRPVAVTACSSSAQVANGEHDHDSFVAGGHRVGRTSNGFSNAWLANFMHFADCNAAVLEADLSASIDTAVNLDPGFPWDVVICFSNDLGGTTGQKSDADFSFGFYVQTGDDQACMIWNSNHGQSTPGDASIHMSNIYAAGKTVTGTGAIEYGVDISAGAGTSCDLTTRIAGGAGNRVTCLFIGFTGTEVARIIEWDSPTAEGSHVVSGQGITPIALIQLLSFAAAYNGAEADADGGAYGISFVTPDQSFCLAGADEVGSDPSDVQSHLTDQAINVPRHDGAAGLVAAFTGMIAGGFSHNFTGVGGTAWRQIGLAIGTPLAGGPIVEDVNGNDLFAHGDAGIFIDGTGFEELQGSGSVIISPTDDVNDVNAITQTITSWSDRQILFTAVRGTLSLDDQVYVFVINDSAASNADGSDVILAPNETLLFNDTLNLTVDLELTHIPSTLATGNTGASYFSSMNSAFFFGD